MSNAGADISAVNFIEYARSRGEDLISHDLCPIYGAWGACAVGEYLQEALQLGDHREEMLAQVEDANKCGAYGLELSEELTVAKFVFDQCEEVLSTDLLRSCSSVYHLLNNGDAVTYEEVVLAYEAYVS